MSVDLRRFPKLYAILDAGSCARRGLALLDVAAQWRDAGLSLVQYRDKTGTDNEVLRNALALRTLFGTSATLILNDRVHVFQASGFDGIHIGQGDGSVEGVRAAIGPDAVLGVSTHTPSQVADADLPDVSYIAVGPVFATGTKLDADPVVGLSGVELARSLTAKPLVAIGGITPITAPSVVAAGADAVAVISSLLDEGPQRFIGVF